MNCQRLPFAFLLIALCGVAALAQSPPRVWEAPLTLPTYELGPPDPNPPLFDRARTRGKPSYPYPLLDSLTNKRVDKTYRAVFLENEYLRVTALPELGGKLYAIYDKTAGRDVLYTNHVVKYAMVGIRGASRLRWSTNSSRRTASNGSPNTGFRWTNSAADSTAAYYLGNALASKLRFKEALEAWRIATQFDSKNAVAHRNYARALALVEDRKEEAAALERAMALAPDDHHLYLELDRLLAGMKQTERRIKLLEGAPEKARAGAALLQALAAAYVDAGRFAEAAGLLDRHTFGEGEGAALGIYRRAHLALARQHQQSGRHVEAAAAFIKATEYPPNFGVGRPAMESQAREYVAAALEFEAAGRRDEAEKWLRRAAEDALNSPTQPEEPWSEHYYYKAVALDRLGRSDGARALYERLARLNDEQQMQSAEPSPPRGALRFLLAGWGLKALGRNEEARAAFQRALQLDPANARAQAELSGLSR